MLKVPQETLGVASASWKGFWVDKYIFDRGFQISWQEIQKGNAREEDVKTDFTDELLFDERSVECRVAHAQKDPPVGHWHNTLMERVRS